MAWGCSAVWWALFLKCQLSVTSADPHLFLNADSKRSACPSMHCEFHIERSKYSQCALARLKTDFPICLTKCIISAIKERTIDRCWGLLVCVWRAVFQRKRWGMQNRYYSLGSVKHFMSRPELLFIYPSQLEMRRRAGAREGNRGKLSPSAIWKQPDIHLMKKHHLTESIS